MSSANEKRKQVAPAAVGAVIRDPYAAFVLGKGPHPAFLGRKQIAATPTTTPKPATTPGAAKKKGYTGPGLQLATAYTLGAEAFTLAADKAGQASIGWAQKNIGVFGAIYYGRKAQKEGGMSNYAKAMAYGTFAAHGVARMFYPQSLFTPSSGAAAAFMKASASGPFSFPGFVADLAANVVEFGHAVHHQFHHHPPEGGWRQAAYKIGARVPEKHLQAIQVAGAALLASGAVHDLFQAYKDKRKNK